MAATKNPLLKATVDGAKRVAAKIRSVVEGVTTVGKSKDLERIVLNRVRRRFLREVDPEGSPWAPLSPRTKKRNGAIRGPHAILTDSGTLYESIKVIRSLTQTAGVRSNTGAGFRVGTDIPYGAYHQSGTSNMPARPFLGLDRLDERSIVRKVKLIIEKKIKRG